MALGTDVPEKWHRLLGDCIEAVGARAFFKPLLQLIETQLGAAQCMVFSYGDNGVTCLLSLNFRVQARGKHLAKSYLDSGYKSDPLVVVLRDMATTSSLVRVVHLDEVFASMPSAYQEVYYRKPGLADKVAVLLANADRQLIVNFYYEAVANQPGGRHEALSDAYFVLIGRLIRAHFDRDPDVDAVGPLSALSDRERQVCQGILSGLKSEAIGAEIGIAANSVVTYRKRAYAKLGINSRADLFALCRTR